MKMRQFILCCSLSATFFLGLSTIQAQDSSTTAKSAISNVSQVREGDRLMSQGNKNSLTVDMNNVPIKVVEKYWKEYAKQFKGDTKKDRKTDEWFTDNALVPALGGANTVDMYTKFTDNGNSTNMAMWVDLGGAYINQKDFKEKYDAAEKIMLDFALSVNREQIKTLLNDQQDEQKKMEREQRNLEKKNTNLHNDIDDWKKRITKAEGELQVNLKSQEDQKKKIENQQKLVEEIQKKLANMN